MRTIERCLDVLETFLDKKGEVSLTSLAAAAGLNVSTAHRIAGTLVKRGYLVKGGERGKYSLGLKVLEFGAATSQASVMEVALPFLERLNRESGESVNLAIKDNGEAVYIHHLDGNHSLRTFTQVGNRVPLYCTGVGKVLLAAMQDSDIEAIFGGGGLKACTGNTIVDLDRLTGELSRTRQEGVAIDDEETETGIRCVASPVRDSTGKVVAAISVSAPSVRLGYKRLEEMKPAVKRCALDISRALGFKTAPAASRSRRQVARKRARR
jgi:IclR family acetate operon transcriptional repressor